MDDIDELKKRAAAAWDANQKLFTEKNVNRFWWMWPRIVAHQNEIIYGERHEGSYWNVGLVAELRKTFPDRTFKRAISVGCGDARKEMALLSIGLIEHFDLFEISKERISAGKAVAEQKGLSDRLNWSERDGIEHMKESASQYDLVFWDNSLHHMFDCFEAVAASHNCLAEGGVLMMNDFTGATRLQWSDEDLAYATQVRNCFSEDYMDHPLNTQWRIPREVTRPTIESMLASDPSEAADSANILPALTTYFENSTIWPLGGTVYHLALGDVLANFEDGRDDAVLEALLVLDKTLADMGHNNYHAAICVK